MADLISCILLSLILAIALFNTYKTIRDWALDKITKRKEREKK